MIIDLLHDKAFLTFVIGFMTSLFTFIRWMARVNYLDKQKNIIKKGQIDSQVEKMKEDIMMKVMFDLREIVANINKTLDRHEAAIQTLNTNISNVAVIYSNMTDMMANLDSSYKEFEKRMTNVTLGAGLVMGRLNSIETEILDMKNGNIFVRTKK